MVTQPSSGGVFSFSECLSELEGENQEKRLAALQRLGTSIEERSLRVIKRLTDDENPEIRHNAIIMARRFNELGIRLRSSLALPPAQERFSIASSYQLLDEVFAIWSNRAWDYLVTAFIAGAPKLCLIIFILYTFSQNQLRPNLLGSFDLWNIGVLLTVHTIFFRPFALELTGKAFLAGWPEMTVRRRFPRRLSLGSYSLLLRAGLLTFLEYLAIFVVGVVFAVIFPNAEFVLALALFFLILPWNFCRAAMVVLHPLTPDVVTKAMNLAWENTGVIRGHIFDFVWFCVWVYAAFVLSFTAVASFFLSLVEPAVFVCGFLLADVILDPIWVGFQLVLTRLLEVGRKPE